MAKTMKRISTLLMTFCFMVLLTVPAFALSGKDLIVDDAYLLSAGEREKIADYAESVSEKNNTSICIVTTNGIEGSIEEWQEQYFYDNNLGTGSNKNGLMLVIDMENRKWNIMTFGDVDDIIIPYECQYIGEAVRDDLSDSRFYDAFHDYIYLADEHLNLTDSERDYYRDLQEQNNKHEKKRHIPIVGFIMSLFISVGISAGSVNSMRRSMNTRVLRSGASEYMDKDSFHLSTKRDIYLYSTIQKTAKPKEKKESSSGSFHGHSSGGGDF
ncbi:MAG: TPM domain-containing protein [Lachnospiraceae bacterium]|nr:TPM domain-containing protein [Lachnospiraceae bacterium]